MLLNWDKESFVVVHCVNSRRNW